MHTVESFCTQVLLQGDLHSKITSPDGVLAFHDDTARMTPCRELQPARDDGLRMTSGSERLPRLNELGSADARIACIARFAHHEIMAAELFAWALLSFPHAPQRLRRGLLAALVEEQAHARLYVERLTSMGASLHGLSLSGYFWSLVPPVARSADPLCAFLAMQGLTLEQANLDFTIHYRDGFARVGDSETVAILQKIHDDEVGHVRLSNVWLSELGGASDDASAYQKHVPFPLSAARAKGRRFEAGARKRAGMSDAFIAMVQAAKPYAAIAP
jgi:uncharacterized ferritin-like protein (DUF455 family)